MSETREENKYLVEKKELRTTFVEWKARECCDWRAKREKEDQEKRYEKEGNCSGGKAEWAFMSLRHSEEKDGVGTREQR